MKRAEIIQKIHKDFPDSRDIYADIRRDDNHNYLVEVRKRYSEGSGFGSLGAKTFLDITYKSYESAILTRDAINAEFN